MTIGQILYKASNPPTLVLGISTALAGTGAAAVHGNLEVIPAIFCLLFAFFAEVAANLCHRYYDARYGFGENDTDKLYQTDSHKEVSLIIQGGMIAATILAAMSGLALMTMAGWWTLVVAILLLMVVVICNIGPRPVNRTPAYLIATFVTFGPLGVVATTMMQSQHYAKTLLNWFDLGPAVYMGLCIGFLAVNVHLMHNYRSVADDRRNGKSTFTALFGRRASRILYFINGLLFVVIAVGSSILEDYPDWKIYSALPILSFTVNCYVAWRMTKKREVEINRLLRVTDLNLLLFSLLALVELIILGLPDDSTTTFF